MLEILLSLVFKLSAVLILLIIFLRLRRSHIFHIMFLAEKLFIILWRCLSNSDVTVSYSFSFNFVFGLVDLYGDMGVWVCACVCARVLAKEEGVKEEEKSEGKVRGTHELKGESFPSHSAAPCPPPRVCDYL